MRRLCVAAIVVDIALVAVGLAVVASQRDIDETTAMIIALTMAAAVLSALAAQRMSRQGDPISSTLVSMTGALVTAGTVRNLDLGPAGLFVAGVAWLLTPLGVMLIIDRHTRQGLHVRRAQGGGTARPGIARVGRSARWLAVVTAVAAAGLGHGAGPGTWTLATADASLPSTARWALAVVVAASIVALGAFGDTMVRSWNAGRVFTTTALVAIVSNVGAIAWHLAPRTTLFTPATASVDVGYRPWPLTFAVNIPLAALVVFMATVVYRTIVRPVLVDESADILVLTDELVNIEDRIAEWTGDPTARVLYRAGDGGWSDRRGRRVHARLDLADRVQVLLVDGGEEIAYIDHDRYFAHQPGVAAFDARLVSAALSAERDAAIAATRLADAQRASAQLLLADADARAALVSQLAKGPAAELDEIADRVDAGDDLDVIAQRIRGVASDVRDMSHGLHPPELEHGGLSAVLPSNASGPWRRLPRSIEVTAYLLVVEHPDAIISDVGAALRIEVPTGSVSELARERIAVLGGTLRDAGGRVVVDLPAVVEQT